MKTQIGAVDELVSGELEDGDNRIISGSVLSGTTNGSTCVLGVITRMSATEVEKELFAGLLRQQKFSVTRTFLGHLAPSRLFNMTTSTGGSKRAMVPIGNYERDAADILLPYYCAI